MDEYRSSDSENSDMEQQEENFVITGAESFKQKRKRKPNPNKKRKSRLSPEQLEEREKKRQKKEEEKKVEKEEKEKLKQIQIEELEKLDLDNIDFEAISNKKLFTCLSCSPTGNKLTPCLRADGKPIEPQTVFCQNLEVEGENGKKVKSKRYFLKVDNKEIELDAEFVKNQCKKEYINRKINFYRADKSTHNPKTIRLIGTCQHCLLLRKQKIESLNEEQKKEFLEKEKEAQQKRVAEKKTPVVEVSVFYSIKDLIFKK